ncbi:uncharacterized protein IL334_002161 [Kwoniella shivajii]|uniref:Zinc finger Mcm10/DnaG-type domain-containing protein n=1 Tax=Kwoniella shivajii TaxID=564305 RepID=A0ABZ1CUK6_9TREE|nr:hypothetical protein IL334_002161 [Kwoniella shivajii]
MDVDTSDIDAQIAALQKARDDKLAQAAKARRAIEKEEAKVLVGSTPTKASLKASMRNDPTALPSRPAQPKFTSSTSSSSSSSLRLLSVSKPTQKPALQELPSLPTSGPSSMGSSLAALRRSSSNSRSPQPIIARSNGFTERIKPSPSSSKTITESSKNPRPSTDKPSIQKGKGRDKSDSPGLEVEDKKDQIQRDEDSLTIIEKLELGPKEFGLDTEGEEEWRNVEPNSGIRLSKRVLSHEHLQDHLSGRYYLTPSQLYSVIRLSKDGATYDIPVEGDWITIAVVAQRGEVKISGTKDASYSDDDDDDDGQEEEHTKQSLAEALKVDSDQIHEQEQGVYKPRQPWKNQGKGKGKGKGKFNDRKRIPRKYINLTLCALPSRHRTLGKTETTGDALLQLMLFEADAVVREENGQDGEVTRSYRGGSGGAYEKWCNLTEGNVIAILNPRVWRNLRGGSNGPHPLEFPLGLNPFSADSIMLIGQAKDLGKCNAIQKDGNRCKTWVDLRQNSVCEYHVHAAIQRGKSARAEFTASTSSFALSTRSLNGSQNGPKGKLGFDPKRQTGLLPAAGRQAAPKGAENGGGGATYVVGGGVVNTGSVSRGGLKGFGQEYLSEKLGRSRAEKRKRQLEDKEAEKALERLLEREGQSGSTGAKYLSVIEQEREKSDKKKISISKNGKSEKNRDNVGIDEMERKRPFGAEAIKRIGFDPTSRAGNRDSEDVQRRLEAIASLKGEEPGCRLERLSKRLDDDRKAKRLKAETAKIASKAIPPDNEKGQELLEQEEEGMIDLDSS